MTIIEEDKNVQKQNSAFVHIDRKRHDAFNSRGWDTPSLELAGELRMLVSAAYWGTTYKPNINKKAITVKVDSGRNAQIDEEAMPALKAFIDDNNIVERVCNGHRYFDIVKWDNTVDIDSL